MTRGCEQRGIAKLAAIVVKLLITYKGSRMLKVILFEAKILTKIPCPHIVLVMIPRHFKNVCVLFGVRVRM